MLILLLILLGAGIWGSEGTPHFFNWFLTPDEAENDETAPPASRSPQENSGETKQEEDRYPLEATILGVGDVMCHTPQITDARLSEGGFDFSPSFKYIAPYLEDADLAAANLETTLAGGDNGGYSGYPLFNSPDQLAYDLEDAGFDLLATANNHSLDQGEKGVDRTREVVEDAGLKAFGTARSEEERKEPLIMEANDLEVAFLAYTDSTNGIPLPGGRDYMVNLLEVNTEEGMEEARKEVEEDVNRARREGADLVAVYMHWGQEYQFEPHPSQEEQAKMVTAAGADVIFGSHPHVIQPMEYLSAENEEGEKNEALVIYSMGNFVSNQHYIPGSIPTEEVKYGLVPQVHLKKQGPDEEAEVASAEYLLTWVNRDHRYQVIPIHYLLEGTPEEYSIPGSKFERIAPVTDKIVERLDGFEPAPPLKPLVE